MKPLVSVIMTTWNGEKTIKRAIDSVLCQTYSNIELCIYVDGSEDKTEGIIKEYKNSNNIKYRVGRENKRGAYGRNQAAKLANGKYVALLDDDDEWLPSKIEKQVEYLERNTEYSLVLTDYADITDKTKKVFSAYSSDYVLSILEMSVNLAAGSTLMVKKTSFDEIGGFDENFKFGHQDLEFLLTLLRKNKVGHISEILTVTHGRGGRAARNAQMMEDVKNQLLNKFEKDILKYPKKVQNKIYARQWLQVSRFYAMEGDVKNTLKFLIKSLKKKFLWSYKFKVIPFESYFVLPLLILKTKIRG